MDPEPVSCAVNRNMICEDGVTNELTDPLTSSQPTELTSVRSTTVQFDPPLEEISTTQSSREGLPPPPVTYHLW